MTGMVSGYMKRFNQLTCQDQQWQVMAPIMY